MILVRIIVTSVFISWFFVFINSKCEICEIINVNANYRKIINYRRLLLIYSYKVQWLQIKNHHVIYNRVWGDLQLWFFSSNFSFFFKKFQLIKVWKHRQGSDILYFDSFVEWNLFNFRKIIMSMKQHPKKMKTPSIVMKTSYHRTEIVTKKQNCCSLILEFNNYQGNSMPTKGLLRFEKHKRVLEELVWM